MFRPLHPEKAYVTEDVYADPRAAARVERMMTAVVGASLERVSYAELNEIAPRRWGAVRRWGETAEPRDPDLVFTMGKFWPDEKKAEFRAQYPSLRIRDLFGFQTVVWRPDGELDWRENRRGCVCQSAWQLHTIMGCPFRCAYCGLGGLNRILVNMEEYVGHLDEVCERKPVQSLYKWDNQSDVSCFEPEYGASKLLIEYFAQKPGKYLEIYTGKSDNIDDLLALDHRGKTIIQWSVSARTQSTAMEPESAPWDRRVEAARKCQEAGYTVRYRFSPIVPVRDWQAENAELIERIFARSKPGRHLPLPLRLDGCGVRPQGDRLLAARPAVRRGDGERGALPGGPRLHRRRRPSHPARRPRLHAQVPHRRDPQAQPEHPHLALPRNRRDVGALRPRTRHADEPEQAGRLLLQLRPHEHAGQ